MMTLEPSLANLMAMSRPRPEAPPVMRTMSLETSLNLRHFGTKNSRIALIMNQVEMAKPLKRFAKNLKKATRFEMNDIMALL